MRRDITLAAFDEAAASDDREHFGDAVRRPRKNNV